MQTKSLSFLSISLLMLLFLLFPRESMAQFEKGHKIIGGGFSVTYQNNKFNDFFSKSLSTGIQPTIGLFLSEKSLFGISPQVYHTYSSDDFNYSTDRDHSWNFGGSVFYRRFFKASEQIRFFVEPQAGVYKRNYGDIETLQFFSLVSPGLAMVISEKFWLEAKFGGLGYNHFQASLEEDRERTSRYFLNFYSFSSIGLFYILK
jgi:hypothetical protein